MKSTMEGVSGVLAGFSIALQPFYLFLALVGAAVGTAIGVLPGIGPSLAISLLLPFTYKLVDPVGAFILFGGIYYGCELWRLDDEHPDQHARRELIHRHRAQGHRWPARVGPARLSRQLQ